VANTQATFGFQQFGYQPGGSPDYQQSTRGILKTYSTVIGFGDVVQRTNATSAYIIQGNAATTLPIEGIFVGCSFILAGGSVQWSPYWPGNVAQADVTAYVIDAASALFKVAALNTAIVSSNIGNYINYTTGGGTINTVGQGLSVMTVDQSTIATTTGTTASGLPFIITGLYPGIGNGSDPTTPYNWVIVRFNNQIGRVGL
jgi:hypothetical protein